MSDTYALLTAAMLFSIDTALGGTALAAGPASKWGHDEATSEWFRSLKNSYGVSCCDYTDGYRVEDVDWKGPNPDGSYDVKIGDKWLNIDKEHVLTGNNRVGYAILWRNPSVDPTPNYPGVYCFLPGTGS